MYPIVPELFSVHSFATNRDCDYSQNYPNIINPIPMPIVPRQIFKLGLLYIITLLHIDGYGRWYSYYSMFALRVRSAFFE